MWNVPADHDIFDELNTAQWLWYFHNLAKDQDDYFVDHRNLVEYHASFSEPELVKKIRKSREETINLDDTHFNKGLEKMFGRGLSREGSGKIEGGIHDLDLEQISNLMSRIHNQAKSDPSYNYRHWANIELE